MNYHFILFASRVRDYKIVALSPLSYGPEIKEGFYFKSLNLVDANYCNRFRTCWSLL